MKLILGNFGTESLALIEWAHQQNCSDIVLCYFDTGWAGSQWGERIASGQQLLTDYGYQFLSLKPEADFVELTTQRQHFPTAKSAWCVSFLKALPLSDWLEKHDTHCQAEIWLGLYRDRSRAYSQLNEYVYDSEHFDGRTIRYPLYNYSEKQIISLAKQTKLPLSSRRSLECEPCVNNNIADFQQIQSPDIQKVDSLEQKFNITMFDNVKPGDNHIQNIVKWVQSQPTDINKEQFDMQCGSIYGCGT